jgi:hypothetical protein
MANRIYTGMSGGLGDIINYILEPGADFGYFGSLPPGTARIVIVWCVTSSAFELLANHPHIESFQFHDHNPPRWEQRTAAIGEALHASRLTAADKAAMTWTQPTFKLNDEEAVIAKGIIDAGPFVTLHPFAGDPLRDFKTNNLSPEYCAEVMCKAGIHVVLLGGKSRRWAHGSVYESKRDDFDFTHDFFTDLRDVGTTRLHTHLVGKSRAFIGSTSAYNCAAHQYGVPTLAFTMPLNRTFIEKDQNGIFALMRERKTETYYFDRMPSDPYGIVTEFARKHTQ